MATQRLEVRYEHLYVKVPGTDKLRKTAVGRLRHLTFAGWRETKRIQETDFITVRLERTGHKTPMMDIPYVAPQVARPRRDNFGGRGGGGGNQRGGGPGGPGGGRGPGGPGGPGQGAPAGAPAAPRA